jgi:hypothetical protein
MGDFGPYPPVVPDRAERGFRGKFQPFRYLADFHLAVCRPLRL